jgi:NADH-quinone oxidoreductase subunit J
MELNWQAANFSFWLVTAVVLVSGAAASFSRSIVTAAYALFFTLLGMAGYYALLGSGFLAITQVIIYVGGILVLLMFGVLLTSRPVEETRPANVKIYALGTVAGALLLLLLLLIIFKTNWPTARAIVKPETTVRPLGELILTNYLLPLELAGVALLLCLLGAAYLVRRRER